MMSFWRALQACGGSAALIVFVGAVATVMSVAAVVTAFLRKPASLVLGILSLVLAFLCLATGFAGMQVGRRATAEALHVSSLDPETRRRIAAEGEHESVQCVNLAGTGAVLPLVLGILASLVSLTAKRRQDAGAPLV